jgi:hypothetical protein
MAKLRKFAPGQFQIINKRDGNTPYLNPNQTIRNLMLTSKKKNINIKCEYCEKKQSFKINEIIFYCNIDNKLTKFLNNFECTNCGCLKHKLI